MSSLDKFILPTCPKCSTKESTPSHSRKESLRSKWPRVSGHLFKDRMTLLKVQCVHLWACQGKGPLGRPAAQGQQCLVVSVHNTLLAVFPPFPAQPPVDVLLWWQGTTLWCILHDLLKLEGETLNNGIGSFMICRYLLLQRVGVTFWTSSNFSRSTFRLPSKVF